MLRVRHRTKQKVWDAFKKNKIVGAIFNLRPQFERNPPSPKGICWPSVGQKRGPQSAR
jgi:hypothetical protein